MRYSKNACHNILISHGKEILCILCTNSHTNKFVMTKKSKTDSITTHQPVNQEANFMHDLYMQ